MAKISKIIVGLSVISLFLTACGGDAVGNKYVEFGKCLTENGVKMYGTFWCPHCQNQKAMFGKLGFAEVDYIECDPRGPNQKAALCESRGIDGYPTWEFGNGLRISGEVTFQMLSEKSGCPLPNEATQNGTTSAQNIK